MSGPKGGTLSVDWESLRLTEAREAEELRQLEAQRERDEAQKERLARLREKEARRQAREEARRRREAELAEAERRRALETYNQVRSQLEAVLQIRGDIEGRFPGVNLPTRPDIEDLSGSADSEAIGQATDRLRAQARTYQLAQDQALMRFHQEAAASNATNEMQDWLAQFRTRAVRTASDVIIALESNTLISAQRQRDARLKAYAVEAKRLVQALGKDEADLPDSLLERLDQVLNSTSDNQGNLALARFKESVNNELSRRKAEEQRMEKERVADEMRHRRARIADEITGVLEDMGYSVSDIDETVSTQDGCLYAWNKHWPEHVVRIDMAANSEAITAAPLRVVTGQEQDTGATDARKRQEADVAFDTAWCQREVGGIKEFKQRLKDRKVLFSYSRKHLPGEQAVGTVPDTKLGMRIQAVRQGTSQVAPTKARERKPTGGKS